MKAIKILIVVSFLNLSLQAASMKETALISSAGGAICKVYAEEIGGDAEAFSEMNILVLQIAEKMGYTSDFQSYQADVATLRNILQKKLLQMHGSKLNVYNNWCIKLYNGFQDGLVKAQ
ncbi:MAG: hypothetical protein RQ763_04660 [Sulfurimonas sp.]|uniref:hypothetical protein n=1 Tax=Sulfurimonas sp. TaxID=2022749 RepID=UPI0028CBE74F|nr:hypothetical protein [Sulfurimonas sp.]MDT8338472.1 hypothetical protein [Sulfurimonas sp.]